MLLIMVCGYLLIQDLLGGRLLAHSAWDSYTLQAMAWRSGMLHLPENYPWLELAVYGAQYYVSFPPLPSVVMLPLTLIFGANTPNNLVMMLYALATSTLCYIALRRAHTLPRMAAFTALFVVWGSNMMWMSTDGGVWFQAQALNMLLLCGALVAAQRDKRITAYALVALAVGCRPFSAVAFIPLCAAFYLRDRRAGVSFWHAMAKQVRCLVLPALIAGAYMWYNYARFGNVLEFGHNYLPEFTDAQHGQFWLGYIPQNLYNIFLRPIKFVQGARLSYPLFDGFMFYIANPIFLLLFVRMIADIRHRRMDMLRVVLLASMLLELLLLCAHKTFGGWQFGARYTVDLIPLALAYMLAGGWQMKRYERLIAMLGIMLNIYGALAMTVLA